MKVIIQRVLSASVTVEHKLISSIGKGILVFAAIAPWDTEKDIDRLVTKLLKLRIWDDESGSKWKKNVCDISGEILCVSQFTLLASTKRGTKPNFRGALGSSQAKDLYEQFVSKIRGSYSPEKVKDGIFQAMMEVALINDGPVTLEMSTEPTDPVDDTSSLA